MLLSAIVLDTSMTASAALVRLARHGYWTDPRRQETLAAVLDYAARLALAPDEAERRLARNPYGVGAALRRQWGMQVLWYARYLEEVLHRCSDAPPGQSLLDVLDLHEPDSRPPIQLADDGATPNAEGVVFVGDVPVGVSVMMPMAAPPPPAPAPPFGVPFGVDPGSGRGPSRGGGAPPAVAPKPPVSVTAWPRLDAPNYVPARTPFTVVVGLARERQAGVGGGQVSIAVPAGLSSVDVSVELIADGIDAPEGWARTLRVDVADPTATSVSFVLVGRDPAGPEWLHLTTLEVRYVLDGTVCGTASRALVIGDASTVDPPPRLGFGDAWLDQPPTATPVVLRAETLPADLTIEIAKPDGNPANGRFECRLFSPHPLPSGAGPFPIDLGDDARTFARSIVSQIRDYANDPLVDNLLVSLGMLIAEKLPLDVLDAVRAVAAVAAPRAPAVLVVSADPYVPWELAHVDPPLDAARPPFLGAQVTLGRWLRDPRGTDMRPASPGMAARPPAQPPSTVAVKHMAVMAGLYRAASGLRPLPAAEQEAAALAQAYDAVKLAASTLDVKRLLDAQLTHGFEQIGGVEAIHFAGHGDVDPNVVDGSLLMLSEGKPLPSILFRSAKYGGDRQPLFFLNACMIGVGGELLGDMGGFPGNCLRGGFGALLGALWEVDDTVARQFALDFWRRALPVDGSPAEPVGDILRDLRAKYSDAAGQTPAHTWLAYVYYGHPRLTLQRAV